jgi:hypothetical protein
VSVPSSSRDFQFTTDVDASPSFTLSDASSTQVYSPIDDGSYSVTLEASQTVGYDVDVSCVGTTATNAGETTTFDVAGDDVTCTFTLTGELLYVCFASIYCGLKLRYVDHAPTISCPEPVTIDNDPTKCDAVVTFSDPIVSDSNTDAAPTFSCDPASGSTFDVGVKQVTCTVTDSANQQGTPRLLDACLVFKTIFPTYVASCVFNVQVTDVEVPMLYCPADRILSNDAGVCGATVTYTPDIDENCPDSITSIEGIASGSLFPIGETETTISIIDASGNVGGIVDERICFVFVC